MLIHPAVARADVKPQWISEGMALAREIEERAVFLDDATLARLEEEALAATGDDKLQRLLLLTEWSTNLENTAMSKRLYNAYKEAVPIQDNADHRVYLEIISAYVPTIWAGDFSSAIEKLGEVLKRDSLTPNARVYALALLGNAYGSTLDLSNALALYNDAQRIADTSDVDPYFRSRIDAHKLNLFYEIREGSGIVDTGVSEYELSQENGFPYSGVVFTYSLAEILQAKGFFDDAEVALGIHQRIAERVGKAEEFFSNLFCGDMARRNGNYEQAFECYKRAEAAEGLVPRRSVDVKLGLATTLQKLGRSEEARFYLAAAKADPQFLGAAAYKERAPYVESLILDGEGRGAEAFSLLEAYHYNAMRQESARFDALVQEVRAMSSLQADRLRERAALLDKQSDLQAAVIRRQTMIVALTLLILLVAAGFGGRLFLYNKRLNGARLEALAASKAKSEFLANMSHEIRTPMNGVLGMSELLQATTLNDKQKMYADTIYKSGAALLTIINDILDFSKLESGKMQLDPTPFNLRNAVEDVATLLGSGANDKGIELVVRVHPSIPDAVNGDGGRIRQILTNLVGNAIKFTHKGYVLIDVTGERSGDMVDIRIVVEDTGIGIPQDKIDTIFEQFTQAESSTTRKFGGTGLGLSITKSLVDAMGGEIGLESEADKGSLFWVSLSLPIAQSTPVEAPETLSVEGVNVLVVDDLPINRRILHEQLSNWSMRPVLVDSGTAALAELRKKVTENDPYPLAILDFHMPGMDGAELATRINDEPDFSDTALIVLSSGEREGAIQSFRSAGVVEVLTKPARASLLSAAIAKALSERCATVLRSAVDDAGDDVVRETGSQVDASNDADGVDNDVKLKVLVAEDNEINRMVISSMVDQKRYSLQFAEDGRQAYEQFTENNFDLVLMDVSMPEMDGMESTKAIRAFEAREGRQATPIIALTAHAMEGDRQRFLSAGMTDYLTKPVGKDILLKTLEHWTADAPEERAAG
ncbi:MAG: response regulator [Pseudomonadota bacterium]